MGLMPRIHPKQNHARLITIKTIVFILLINVNWYKSY